jgi:dCMP deaminase
LSIHDKLVIMAAEAISLLSDDKSTKIGAIITRENSIIATGYNQITDGVKNTQERHVRPIKYRFYEHAERDAIYKCARFGISTQGATLYLNRWFPCTDCARAIIASGIVRIFAENSPSWPENWWLDMRTAYDMLSEAEITMELR